MPSTGTALASLLLLFFALSAYPFYLSLPAGVTEQPCHDLVSVGLDNATESFANGSVLLDGLVFPNDTQYRDAKGRLRGCPCLLRKCIRLCCQPGEFHDKLHLDRPGVCYKPDDGADSLDELDLPPLPEGVLEPAVSGYGDFYRIHRKGCVAPKQVGIYLSGKQSRKSDSATIKSNGHFQLVNSNDDVTRVYTHEPDNYCLAYSGRHNSSKILSCTSPAEANRERLEYAMRWSETAGSWISVVLLFVTFAVYSIEPALRNLPGKTLMATVASLILAFSSLPFIKHAEMQRFVDKGIGCKITGMEIQM